MKDNLLLEQYGKYKRMELANSPYCCLLNKAIDINPHQVNAFCAAVQRIKTGGIILADEVGLGKTIEAGLTLKYLLSDGFSKIMIVVPAALRKQWENELAEKFDLDSRILDRATVDRERYEIEYWIDRGTRIIITSYDYSAKFMKRFPQVKWDLIIIDEAHNLRNVFHGTKRAKNLYDRTKGIPKLLLTATPLQNSLSDLHGLVSFVDPRIFGDEKIFVKKYLNGEKYDDLKEQLMPVLYRTLRKDVAEYLDFRKRECLTVDFHLSNEEKELYDLVNAFLKRDSLYSIPSARSGLIIIVIRKLLASSSFALVDTFVVLKKRLKKLYEGTRSSDAQDGFDLFWAFVEDELDETETEDTYDEEEAIRKQQIQDEMNAVEAIIEKASSIRVNAKIDALLSALELAFEDQQSKGIDQKAVVFTESKRTQRYIADELIKHGYDKDDILLFNGDFSDEFAKQIYKAWKVAHFGETDYGKSVEYKQAIVDYFRNHARVMIVTDTGSEGLNLQFCNTVINYDLPWNPQKVEQRIGRCHRYGQKHDVLAINLLNTDNEADKRVYQILSDKFELFKGIFGASDVALGALESGAGFEKLILDIYQKCNTDQEVDRAFDKLDKKFSADDDLHVEQLQNLLLSQSHEEKKEALSETKREVDQFLRDQEYWLQVGPPEMDNQTYFWVIRDWGEKELGCHGWLVLGSFCDNAKILYPVLEIADEKGNLIHFEEHELIQVLEKADDEDIRYFTPGESETQVLGRIYDQLQGDLRKKYKESVTPVIEYNKKKLNNWLAIQNEQIRMEQNELESEIEELLTEESRARDSLLKSDIFKKIGEKNKRLTKLRDNFARKEKARQMEVWEEIKKFNQQFEIYPILHVNIVLKF